MRWVRAAVVASLLLASFTASHANAVPRERMERQEYFLGELVPDCYLFTGIVSPPELPVPSNKGGACFRIRPFELDVTIKVEDASGMPVAGTYQFETRSGTSGTYTTFCESFTRRIPSGAARLVVFIHGPSNGATLYGPSTDPPACLGRGSTGAGTRGTITARFKLDPRYFQPT